MASKFHSSIRNVRIVASTGVCKATGKHLTVNAHTSFKAVYINNQSQWRTIATGTAFKNQADFAFHLKAIEAAAKKAPTCNCGAKKFKAKSGNVVCADACWANNGWGRKQKKWQGTKKKSTSRPSTTQQRKTKSIPQIKKKPLSATPIQGTYTTFVPGQLVKIVEPQQNTLSSFVGTVTKVEPVGNDLERPLTNVSVLWMNNGQTERHNNYNSGQDTATYLVHVA